MGCVYCATALLYGWLQKEPAFGIIIIMLYMCILALIGLYFPVLNRVTPYTLILIP